jgi:hypothetical protein
MRYRLAALFIAVSTFGGLAPADPSHFDGAAWIADLEQMRAAIATRYANYDWLTHERGIDLDSLFKESAERLRHAGSDAEAKAVFDRIVRRIGDGHVEVRWPADPATTAIAAAGVCATLGFDASQSRPGVARGIAGYRPLTGDDGDVFPAGTLPVGTHRIGIVRIGVFSPQGSPTLCDEATKALAITPETPCEKACRASILAWTYRRFTDDLESRLRQLGKTGADVLLIDLSDNGGGSEWAEAVARMVTAKPIISARVGMLRGAESAAYWQNLARQLHEVAGTATPNDRAKLTAWAGEADRLAILTSTACEEQARCERVVSAGYATGLVNRARAGTYSGKPWGRLVFNAAQYAYHDGVWSGAVITLVDQETWSAAEEFAALMQDNQVGVVLGTRTGGAGCGHSIDRAPVTLTHSNAALYLPDCIRFRPDGSNEVNGIIPDITIASRFDDSLSFKAKLVQAALRAAVDMAIDRNRQSGRAEDH